MSNIRDAVDHCHAAVLSHSSLLIMAIPADHDAIHIPRKHPRSIPNRLTTADLGALCPHHHGVASQLVDTHFKGHPGPSGRLLKDHPQALTLEIGMLNAVLCLIFQ